MSIELARQIIAATPMLGRVEKVEYLEKGFSTEKKYVLWEYGAPAYLLKLAILRFDRGGRQISISCASTTSEASSAPNPIFSE